VPIVRPDTPMIDVIREITRKRLGMTVVADGDGRLAGIVTDGDLRRALGKTADVGALVARDLMTRNPKTIAPSALAAQAWAVMEQLQITSLVVVADGEREPAGVIHLHDVLRAGVV